MPADDPFAFVAAERKAFKRPHWREKLFSKEKNRASTDQQIEDFLGPSRGNPVPQSIAAATPRGLPTPPRLDVSSHQWPSSQDLSSPSPVSNPSSATDAFPPVSISTPPQKPRVRKGLRVKFSTREPEVIGEGGDESEEPTVEISLSRKRQRSRQAGQSSDSAAQPETGARVRPPDLRVDTSFGERDGRRPHGSTRQPSPSRHDPTAADWRPLLINNPQDADFLMALSLGESGSRLSFRASPDSNSFARRIRAKMQAEEGQALQNRIHEPPSPANEEPETRQPVLSPSSSSSLYDTPPASATEKAAPMNTLRSPPSPVAHRPGNASPMDRNLPPNLTPSGSVQRLSPPQSQPTPNEQSSDRQVRPSSRENREVSRSPQPPKVSLRSIANQLGDTAFIDFKAYVGGYASIYRLAAEGRKPLMETSLAEWVRGAVWWFLRGKTRLEAFARSRPSSSGSMQPRSPSGNPKQAVVDLGKALWINENIIPQHPELSRYGSMGVDAVLAVANTTGDKQLADLLGLHQGMMNHLRSLAISIKRNNIFSTLSPVDSSADHLDTSVWVQYPFFAPDVSAVLSGAATRSMIVDRSGKGPNTAQMMPLGDNNRYFSYGSMFVDVYVSSEDDDSQQFSVPCSLSIIRDRADWYVLAAITSQSELVNIMIQSDRKQGPTWDDVDWQVRNHSMQVRLPRGFELDVMFQEDDFKMIWNIVKYTLKTEASLQPEAGESVIFESTLKIFHYMDPGTPKAFPAEPIERCRLRLFERSVTVTEGTGSRSMHQGFRLSVVTSPKVKTLSNVRHILAFGAPVVFGLLRGDDGAPALLLKVTEDGRTRSMLMTFNEVSERTTMHSLLLGMVARERELKTPDLPLRSYAIEQPGDKVTGQPAVKHLQFPAGNVSVIDQDHEFVEHGYGPTILSEHLRVFIATEWGSVTDRINLGPGELRLALDVHKSTGVCLYRPGQQDLTVSVAENLVPKDMPDTLTEFLQMAKVKPMVRRFDFGTIQDLHAFQAAVTGFKVLFDGFASSFTISRRRMVVPIYKKWEATKARIQVVQQEKVIQLLAFFADFSHGTCMNFVLKSTDTCESFTRSGKFGTRIVDAKFALPRTADDPSSDFVCLDMPEYPIEHDDIAIAFDSETDRRNFQAAVPGSVREPSRMGSLRR